MKWCSAVNCSTPERIALPDDSILLVEVRSDASPEASLLADERERLEGRQVPIAFQLRVGKEELAEAANPVLRGAIISASASFQGDRRPYRWKILLRIRIWACSVCSRFLKSPSGTPLSLRPEIGRVRYDRTLCALDRRQ